MIPPQKVRKEPEYIQTMYIREFKRVEEQTGSVLAGRKAANRLLFLLKRQLDDRPVEQEMAVTMIAHITEMNVASDLPAGILARIKQKDPHPFFAVYDIGEEGVSVGTAESRQKVVTKRKYWSFRAIKELARRIKENAASIIIGHGNPVIVGQVVHAFNRVIKNTLHALAVVHVTNADTIKKVKIKELDVCSVEGNVTLARSTKSSSWFVKSVEKIDRLALGNSRVDTPGFSGAGILATIQELKQKEKRNEL